MDNINDIKVQLDNYYQEYKDNKNTLNTGKTKTVAKLITDIVLLKNGSPHDAAIELARFSADVSGYFFETVTKAKTLPLRAMEDVLREMLATDTDQKLSQYYVPKFSSAIVSVIRCYKDETYHSSILPELVGFMARFAVRSNKSKSKFYDLINNSAGEIFRLDYSYMSKESLTNIWHTINNIYPDLTKIKYSSLITEWGKKYGFIKDVINETSCKQDKKTSGRSGSVSDIKTDMPFKNNTDGKILDVSKRKDISTEEKTVKKSKECANNSALSVTTSDKSHSNKNEEQVLYERIKKDIDKEQEAIITAFTDMIAPIGKAFESIKCELNKSHEISAENISLKTKIADLENQLSEQKTGSQKANQALMAVRIENDELKSRISFLESRNSELDMKLNDAYAINSRESSLEAEKIRSELKKAFTYLYEDWLDYEFSDVSEENYESLQAIIKKMFRSLERNGIDFKGNK